MNVVDLQSHEEMHDLPHLIVFILALKPEASDVDKAILEAKVLLPCSFPNLILLLICNIVQQFCPSLHVLSLHSLRAILPVEAQQKPSEAFTLDTPKGALHQPSIIHE